jgi:hypothetical protein
MALRSSILWEQGLLTRLFGHEIYMYGYPGLTLGYVIYTIPTAIYVDL